MQKQSLISLRGQMAAVGVVLWFLLALWSIAAFWQHIDELKPTYSNVTKLGAIAGEVALLALVLWHCFSRHIGVRFWALILGFVLSGAILIHAGALRGMAEAQTAQIDAEKRLEDTMTRMSREQMRGTKQKAKVAETAQKEVADTVRAGKDKVKDSSILPRWYLDGWMYSALFLLSLACVGIIFALMMRNDIDANFDGVADHLQGPPLRFQPPPGGPFVTDKDGNVVWAPGYGPNGTGHRPGNDSDASGLFPNEIDANATGRLEDSRGKDFRQ